MRLRITNLGPVREAELDLSRDFIVLTGPNNSGKTYLTWAAYSLARLSPGVVKKLEPPAGVVAWVDRLFEARDRTVTVGSLLEIADDVFEVIANGVQKQLADDFAAPKDRFRDTRIEISEIVGDGSDRLSQRGSSIFLHEGKTIGFVVGAKGKLSIVVHHRPTNGKLERSPIEDLGDAEIAELKRGLGYFVLQFLFNRLFDSTYFAFPVERLAINLFARELAANRTELVDDLLSAGSDPEGIEVQLQRRAGRYPLVIRDALQNAIRMPRSNELGPLAALADDLERDVLGGSIQINAHDELEFIPGQESVTVSLGLHQSASVIKSLASLVLYLRYWAKPGHRLVIDEPELNLHPDNQRRVARVLAKAVNSGLKIMMSTHSDYVIRELNNLIMLGQGTDVAQSLIDELGYDTKSALQGRQLGVYLVNEGRCTLLPVSETGFEMETIDDEIHRLNHDSQVIFQRLFCS